MPEYKPQPGEWVRAFHPRMFGVVCVGTVVSVGTKYVRIDFGPLRGNEFNVIRGHVLGRAE